MRNPLVQSDSALVQPNSSYFIKHSHQNKHGVSNCPLSIPIYLGLDKPISNLKTPMDSLVNEVHSRHNIHHFLSSSSHLFFYFFFIFWHPISSGNALTELLENGGTIWSITRTVQWRIVSGNKSKGDRQMTTWNNQIRIKKLPVRKLMKIGRHKWRYQFIASLFLVLEKLQDPKCLSQKLAKVQTISKICTMAGCGISC